MVEVVNLARSRAIGRALGVSLAVLFSVHLAAALAADQPSPEGLEAELERLAETHGFAIKGLEKTRGVPLSETEGSLQKQLKTLLSGFNYAVMQTVGGEISQIIISSPTGEGGPVALAISPIPQADIRTVEPTIAALDTMLPGDESRKEKNSAREIAVARPVDNMEVSSDYGMRLHPILGYSTMHRGVDFAAPAGASIYAAAAGVVVAAGRNGGFGLYVRVRHDPIYETAYAHLAEIAGGVVAGARVAAGQVIGAVGSTGRSTGPHLHYEVIVNGEQVDPMTAGPKLSASRALANFRDVPE